ncbi:MAG TPA: hypothetical protein VMS56_04815 [Thermoanaerobaculia bacterium]|nr:hypothetical protein [Thermoanaerobaculia bacterium]
MAILLLAATLISAPGEEIVLRTGERIAVAGEIRVEGTQVVFRTPAGRLYSIALDEVDLEKTAADPDVPAAAGSAPEKAPEAEPAEAPPAERKLVVSKEEKERLLRELEGNRSGTEAPEQRALTREGLEEELDRREREREREGPWRAAARAIRERIAQSREAVERLRQRERRLDDEIMALLALGLDPGNHLLQRDQTRADLDRARASLAATEREMAGLEEEARRAGALPGWLRD